MSAAELPAGIERLRNGKLRARYRCKGCAKHPSRGQHGKNFPPRPSSPGADDGGVRAAQKWLRENQVAVEAGTYVAPGGGRVTFADYAAERTAAWRRHKPSTRAAVEGHMRNHLLPTFGHLPVGQIKPRQVECWVSVKSMELAPSTLHVAFSWLRRVFKDAVTARLLPASPCEGVELPEKSKREVRPLPLAAVDALTAAMPDRLACVVTVAAWSGLRSGEVLGLRRHRLDLLGRRGADGRRRAPSIMVAEQLQYLSGPPQLVPPKTKRSERRVPIPGVLVDALAAHMARYPVEAEGFVFTGRTGQPLRRTSLNEAWNRAVKVAGLPPGTHFHDLRHSYASLLIEAGESVKVVSARLGHASAVETLETYAHLWPDSDEHTVTVLDAAWRRHVSPECHESTL